MKKLSFALALALICISMFSCDDKSVISPLNEEFKITTFSPVSGLIGSKVTLFGQNLDKDSIVSVTFGDQTAEILTRSSDSVIVKVPEIAVGFYDITVKTKTKSYVYVTKYEVLQNSFKITSFFPVSGFIGSKVTLFGENLDNDSIVLVLFGELTAEIISRSSDSIIVKVPEIAVGFYDITVKTKTQSYVYDKKYEVLKIDLTTFTGYEVTFQGFKIKINERHEWSDFGGMGGTDDRTLVYDSFSRKYKNNNQIDIEIDGTNQYKITDKFETDTETKTNTINLTIDEFNSIFTSINVNFYKKSKSYSQNQSSSDSETLKFNLTGMNYSYNSLKSELTIKITKVDIMDKLKNFYYESFSGYYRTDHPYSTTYYDTLTDILGFNDNATIEIKFTK